MTRICELTGKRPLKGHKVSHANNKTKRRFLPGIKKVTFKSDLLKKNINLKVSNSALRTVDYKGGIDKFLKKVKAHQLSKRAKKLNPPPKPLIKYATGVILTGSNPPSVRLENGDVYPRMLTAPAATNGANKDVSTAIVIPSNTNTDSICDRLAPLLLS